MQAGQNLICNASFRAVFRVLLFIMLAGMPLESFAVEGMVQTVPELLKKGEMAAQQENYPLAIQQFQQASQIAPGNLSIRRNLTVLYINAGVQAQSRKEYPKAQEYFAKAKPLLPGDTRLQASIQESVAATYFSQAMDLRDVPDPETGHYSYKNVKAMLQKALDILPAQPVFKKAMAGVLMDEAYPLVMDGHLKESVALLEQALAVDSQNQTVKGSLANVYVGLAQGDPSQQAVLTKKALELDASPRIQEACARLTDPQHAVSLSMLEGSSASPASDRTFNRSPNDITPSAPRQMTSLSVHQMVSDLEKQLGIQLGANQDLNDRLKVVEKSVYGKQKEGPLAVRSKAVYTDLMGSYSGSLAQSNPQLKQASPFGEKENYLADIFRVTDGKVIRWGKFPLRVYFKPADEKLEGYRPDFKTAVINGFEVWKKATNGFVSMVEIQDPALADITVNWQEDYADRFEDSSSNATQLYKTYTPSRKTRLSQVLQVATMVTPGYFSLAPQALNAAMAYQQYKKVEVIREESSIEMGVSGTKALSPEAALILVQNMAAREFGHVLGLKGLSTHPEDLLYPRLRTDVCQQPSQRDLNTLSSLYNRPPNIILNVR
jgi:predicted Zn-dependent protease/thioredoxin-like negative regulator of GroEL